MFIGHGNPLNHGCMFDNLLLLFRDGWKHSKLPKMVAGHLHTATQKKNKKEYNFFYEDAGTCRKDTQKKLQRDTYFALFCVPFRLFLPTALLAIHQPQVRKLLGVVFLVVGGGFLRRYLAQSTDTFFGGAVWWQPLRLVHAITYGVAGLTLLTHPNLNLPAYLLYLDVCVGVLGRMLLKS